MVSYPIFRGREKQLHRSLIFLVECNASSHVLLLPLYVKLSGGGSVPSGDLTHLFVFVIYVY
jgi:hypothetical protein